MLATVFVYGTLMPGHLRWGLIAPFAVRHQPATVAGQLYDTGQGWPATRFATTLHPVTGADRDPTDAPALRPAPDGPTPSVVRGWLVELAPASASTLLGQLDEVEGAIVADADGSYPVRGPHEVPAGDYRRVRVRTDDGHEAWAYEALEVGATWVPIDGWTGQHEN